MLRRKLANAGIGGAEQVGEGGKWVGRGGGGGAAG